jgi:hypothetical protein
MIAEHISNSIEAYMARVEDEERSRQTSSPVSKKGRVYSGFETMSLRLIFVFAPFAQVIFLSELAPFGSSRTSTTACL